MARKISEVVAEKMAVLEAEIKLITDQGDEAPEEELARADNLLEEWKAEKSARDKALTREAQVDEVVRAAQDQGNRESGDATGDVRRTAATAAEGRRGPEVMRKVDPWDKTVYAEMARSVRVPGGVEVPSYEAEPVISRALAAVEQAPSFVSSEARGKMASLLDNDSKHAALIARHILMCGSPEYRSEFNEYMRTGAAGDLMRTAMSLTNANGGFLVPFYLDPTIILTNAGVAGSIRSISTVKTIATKTWEGITSAGVSTGWTAEGVETADATPTYAQPSITPVKADAWVFGSYEVFQDSGFSSEMGRLLADAKNVAEETAFATANTGATRPRGVVAAVAAVTASIVTAAATNAFVVGDVYNTADAVNPRQAPKASWMANKKIFSKIRQFDTTGSAAFWANLGMGRPSEILGQPAYECSPMTSVVTTGGNVLIVGDFSEYYIVDRVGMAVIYDPLIRSTGNNRPTGQAGFYAWWRVGADVVNADAFRLLQLNQVAAAVALA